ncbi:MAG TPA: hypothetical protein VMW47_09090 [Verrucomicrobiae bacterium]|nr:hypothetical protein [Verrucomicrobiae bacterium]
MIGTVQTGPPDRARAFGADPLPQIHRVVPLVMVTHSFDNHLGRCRDRKVDDLTLSPGIGWSGRAWIGRVLRFRHPPPRLSWAGASRPGSGAMVGLVAGAARPEREGPGRRDDPRRGG